MTPRILPILAGMLLSHPQAAPAEQEKPWKNFSSLPSSPDPRQATATQLSELAKIAAADRYMELLPGEKKSGVTDLSPVTEPLPPEWEPYRSRLKKFRYVINKFSVYVPGTGVKTEKFSDVAFEVITFSPEPARAARWIEAAVKSVNKGNYDHEAAIQYAALIMYQSHFQFPVRGIVQENMGAGQEIYVFVDGVTVSLEGVEKQLKPSFRAKPETLKNYLKGKDAPTFALSLAEVRKLAKPETPEYRALYGKIFAAKPALKGVGKMGRIASVNFSHLSAAGDKKLAATGPEFVNRVRREHQKAMDANENLILNARLAEVMNGTKDSKGPVAARIASKNWYGEAVVRAKIGSILAT